MVDRIYEMFYEFWKKHNKYPNVILVPISERCTLESEAQDKGVLSFILPDLRRRTIFGMDIVYDLEGDKIKIGFIFE